MRALIFVLTLSLAALAGGSAVAQEGHPMKGSWIGSWTGNKTHGNDVLMGFNRTDRSTANKPYFFYANRWTGEGSTNTWFAANTANPYIYNSDLMIFDGSYTRIRQLQLGYTFPRTILNRARPRTG